MKNEILINIISSLIGFFIGNRLSLGRDRRKEFNEATEIIRKVIKLQIEACETGDHDSCNWVQKADLMAIEEYIGIFSICRFKKTCERYAAATEGKFGTTEIGFIVFIGNLADVLSCLYVFRTILKRK